jgi:HrpA-like RNA helicase/predicted RNA-binding protein with RPS1 domain/predicted RNA-binding protein YlqC (UPF0109 family)
MTEEYRVKCKDCDKEFGYSEASIAAGSLRGMSRPERCPECRKNHSRESRSIGIPQIQIKRTGPRKPDHELEPGRLGRIHHPERTHRKVNVQGKFGHPGSNIEFGITDKDISLLFEKMQTHQVSVVVGPTGSGKSTFLPYRLMVPPNDMEQDLFTRYGQIVITQPRIQATRSIAKFVAQDIHGSSLGAGFDVGFRHSGSPASDWRNKLVYITDGTLINWIVSGQISNLSVIMIDEAHERSLNIDLILGLLKQQLPRYPQLKLIIASATINAELFQDFFGDKNKVALLQFRGIKQHRIDAFFPFHDYILKNNRNVPDNMATKICAILKDIVEGEKSEGNILGFLPGEREIETCEDILRQMVMEASKLRDRDIGIYPLYTRLPQEKQDMALAPTASVIKDKIMDIIRGQYPAVKDRLMAVLLDMKSAKEASEIVRKALDEEQINDWFILVPEEGQASLDSYPGQIVFTTYKNRSLLQNTDSFLEVTDRRVVISTNVAETSLTVDGIVYVVDSGLIKESRWDVENSANDLPIIFHSRAGCRQRWGRAGRVRDGEAHMLYTDTQFEDEEIFPAHTVPEIQRSSIEEVVLKAKAAGIGNIEEFEWIQSPPLPELKRAPAVLRKIGALDEDGDLTGYGVELQSFATNIPFANLLVKADQYACGVEMATIAALSQVQTMGGLLSWDRKWDFITRNAVETIHQQLAYPCQDDLEFFLKIYSIFSEAGSPELREKICRQFFIDEDGLSTRVATARSQYMEMLSSGKKADEDRRISFAFLDRLRIILAISLPEEFIFETDKSGAITACGGTGSGLVVKIDKSSVLAEKTPPCFLALSRRITKDRKGKRYLTLSGVVCLKPEWKNLKKYSDIQLAAAMSRILTPLREPENIGRARHRLFLDVLYPTGARYDLIENESGETIQGKKIADPEPVNPVYAKGVLAGTGIPAPEASKDTFPLAGWEDKKDSGIPYDRNENYGLVEDIEIQDIDSNTGSMEEESGEEIKAAGKILPEFKWINETVRGEACEVTGHKFPESRATVVMLRACSAEKETEHSRLRQGQTIMVTGLEIIEHPNGEKGLLVKEIETSAKFLVDSRDLSFSGKWSIVDWFLDKEFEMTVDYRQGCTRLTRLSLIEEPLHNYLKSVSGKIPCKLIEMNGFNLNFLLQKPERDGIIECAYMRKALNDKTSYKIGNTYDLYLYSRYGEAYVYLSVQPAGLLELIEKEKKKSMVFWNECNLRIHTKSPMTTKTRRILQGISDNSDFHNIIDKLYMQSNNIKLVYRFRKMPHEIGKKARREQMLGDPVPVYNRDDKVMGRVSAIFDTNVLVALENGGTGNIPLKYLSWRDIIDPRETVDGDQIVEARVVSQDKRGGGKIHTTLSLLKQRDWPFGTYFEDSVHEVEIVKIDDNFALADLEPGLTGFIHISNIKYGHVSTIAAHLKKGERVSARIKKNNINSIAKNPVNIEFSLKDTIQKELPVPENKYKFLIGRGGNTIRELNERSGCNIYLKEKKGIAEIKGSSQESVDEAVRLIKEVLGKKTDANISEKSKTRSSVTKKKTNFCKVKIPIDKTGLLIGKKGKMISQIKKKSDTFIQIDKGTVHIKGQNEDGIKCAIKMINDLIPEMRELL